MTKLVRLTKICALCASATEVRAMASSMTVGPPDLDGRPAPMLRAAMIHHGVERCAACGYTWQDIAALPSRAAGPDQVRRVLSGAADQVPAESSEACRRHHVTAALQEALGDADDAWRLFLLAAWAADDAGTADVAVLCRRRALAAMEHATTGRRDWMPPPLTTVDVLRRAGLFDEAESRARAALDQEKRDPARLLLRFSQHLCAQRDTRAHVTHEALDWLVRQRPPRSEAQAARDAATVEAGLRIGPFSAAYHRGVWSDSRRQWLVEWIHRTMVPRLAIDELREASLLVYSEYDEDRFCGPISAVKRRYVLLCRFRGPSSFVAGRLNLEIDPASPPPVPRPSEGGGDALRLSWRPNDEISEDHEDYDAPPVRGGGQMKLSIEGKGGS